MFKIRQRKNRRKKEHIIGEISSNNKIDDTSNISSFLDVNEINVLAERHYKTGGKHNPLMCYF